MSKKTTLHQDMNVPPADNSSEDRRNTRTYSLRRIRDSHPDKNPNDPQANEKTRKLIETYNKLKDDKLRGESRKATIEAIAKEKNKQEQEKKQQQRRPASAPPRPRTQYQPSQPRTQQRPPPPPQSKTQTRTQPPPPPSANADNDKAKPNAPPPAWESTPQNHGDRTSQKQREEPTEQRRKEYDEKRRKASEQRRKNAAFSAKNTRKTGQRPPTANTSQNPEKIFKEIIKISDEIREKERDILNNESMKGLFSSMGHVMDEKNKTKNIADIDNNIFFLQGYIKRLIQQKNKLETERKILIGRKPTWAGGKNKTKKTHNDS